MKIAISGPSGSGKDEAARWLAWHTSLRYTGSTSEIIIPYAARKMGVSDEVMFATRHEHRELMLETGRELRAEDPAYLVRKVLNGGDIACGIRDYEEMKATLAGNLVDLVIWIDRPGVAPDPTMGYGLECADVIVANHWGKEELYLRLWNLARSWWVLTSGSATVAENRPPQSPHKTTENGLGDMAKFCQNGTLQMTRITGQSIPHYWDNSCWRNSRG